MIVRAVLESISNCRPTRIVGKTERTYITAKDAEDAEEEHGFSLRVLCGEKYFVILVAAKS